MNKDNKETMKYSQMELARILGEPVDPRKPYPTVVSSICEVDSADPDEYVYYFDVLDETDKVYLIGGNGTIVQTNVRPDTPTLLTFTDVASPEYYITITDLASAKERVIARKVKTINRAINTYETQLIMDLVAAAVPGANKFTLSDSTESGCDHFDYSHLVTMIDSVIDYGDSYTLLVSSSIDKDIKLWDWQDNKYASLATALKDLNVDIVRYNASVTIADRTSGTSGAEASDSPVGSTMAYLIAKDTEAGKPLLFVRKKLDDIAMLGGVISDKGDKPERLIFASPNPVSVGSGNARYLAIGVTGYEQIAGAVINSKALAQFTRA